MPKTPESGGGSKKRSSPQEGRGLADQLGEWKEKNGEEAQPEPAPEPLADPATAEEAGPTPEPEPAAPAPRKRAAAKRAPSTTPRKRAAKKAAIEAAPADRAIAAQEGPEDDAPEAPAAEPNATPPAAVEPPRILNVERLQTRSNNRLNRLNRIVRKLGVDPMSIDGWSEAVERDHDTRRLADLYKGQPNVGTRLLEVTDPITWRELEASIIAKAEEISGKKVPQPDPVQAVPAPKKQSWRDQEKLIAQLRRENAQLRAAADNLPQPDSASDFSDMPTTSERVRRQKNLAEVVQRAARQMQADEALLDGVVPPKRQSAEAIDVYVGEREPTGPWRPPDMRTPEQKMLDAEIGEMDRIAHEDGSEAEVKYGAPHAPAGETVAAATAPGQGDTVELRPAEALRELDTLLQNPQLTDEGRKVALAEQARLREEVAKTRAEAAGVGAEREALVAAEQAMATHEKEYYKKNSALVRLIKSFREKKESTKRLATNLDTAALAYEQKLESRVHNRLEDTEERRVTTGGERKMPTTEDRFMQQWARKYGGAPKASEGAKVQEEFEKYKAEIAKRYRRGHKTNVKEGDATVPHEEQGVIHHEVLGRSEALRTQARLEGMNERQRGMFEKAAASLLAQNHKLDVFLEKTCGGPIRQRIVKSLIIASAISVPLAFVAPTVITAAGGVGAAIGIRAARGAIGTTVGGIAGAGAGAAYEKTFGARRARKREESKGDVAADVAGMTAKRKAFIEGSPEAIAAQRNLWQAIGAIAAGGTTSVLTGIFLQEAGAATLTLAEVPHHELGTPPSPGIKIPIAQFPQVPHSDLPMPSGQQMRMGTSVPSPQPTAPPPISEAPPSSGSEASHVSAARPEAGTVATGPVGLSVEVKAGQGYESMIRGIATELKAHGANQNMYPVGSDAHKLLLALENGKLNDAILKIEKAHAFLRADGSSTVIEKGAHLTVGTDGELHYNDSHNPDTIEAPAHAKATPPLEARTTRPASHMSPSDHTADQLNRKELEQLGVRTSPTPETSRMGAGTLTPPETRPGVNRLAEPDRLINQPPPLAGGKTTLLPESPRIAPGSGGLIRTSLESAMQAHTEPFTNHMNVRIDPNKSAVYLGPSNAPMVYGGDYASRLSEAEAYAKAHEGAAVYLEGEPYIGSDNAPHRWVFSVTYKPGWRVWADPFVRTRPEVVDAMHQPAAEQIDKFIDPEDLARPVTRPTVVT